MKDRSCASCRFAVLLQLRVADRVEEHLASCRLMPKPMDVDRLHWCGQWQKRRRGERVEVRERRFENGEAVEKKTDG